MWKEVHIVCDRCKQTVRGAAKETDGATAGYIEVNAGLNYLFASVGEKHICDACMWGDPQDVEKKPQKQQAS